MLLLLGDTDKDTDEIFGNICDSSELDNLFNKF